MRPVGSSPVFVSPQYALSRYAAGEATARGDASFDVANRTSATDPARNTRPGRFLPEDKQKTPDGRGSDPSQKTAAGQVIPSDEQKAQDGRSIDPSRETTSGQELSEEQQQRVDELKKIDKEVREHEQAHLAAAGPYARGGPKFEFVVGPDGKQYAVGGEVSIDTSPVPGNPQATIQKARAIRAAALAPSSPSSQDRSVAVQAAQLEREAQQELNSVDAFAKSGDQTAGLRRGASGGRSADYAAATYSQVASGTATPSRGRGFDAAG